MEEKRNNSSSSSNNNNNNYYYTTTLSRFFVRGRVLGFWPCRLFPFFYYANVLISVFSVTLIAVFRLIGINYPTTAAEVISLKRAWIAVALIWAEAFFLMAFPLFGIWQVT